MENTRLCALRGRQGFTLIEILVSLVILAILSQIAVPSLSGVLAESRIRHASSQLAADLGYARMLAVRSGRGATVVFDDATTYRIKEGIGASSVVRKTTRLAVDFQRVTLLRPAGVDSVVFNPRGLVSTAVPIGTGVFRLQTTRKGALTSDSLKLRLLGNVQRYQ